MSNKINVKFDLTPLPWQQHFLDVCDNTPRNNNIILIKAARQAGKSQILQIQLLKEALTGPGVSIVVSPVNSQNRKIYLEMKSVSANSPFLKRHNDSLQELEFSTGHTILFLSAAMKDSLRGKTCMGNGNLYVDEAAFISDDIFEILLPVVQVYKANIILTSTPFTRDGFYYNLYMRGMNNDPKVTIIDVTDYDTSALLSDEQKASFKKIMSPQKYTNEVLGQFLDNNSGVFGDFGSVIGLPKSQNKLYVGIDFAVAVGGDDTAISIVNENCEQVAIFNFNDVDADKQPEHITQLLLPYLSRIDKIVAEKNSIGNVYCPLLKSALSRAGYKGAFETFQTSNSSKNRLVEKLQVLIGKGEVTLLDDKKQTLQLNMYESTVNNKTKSVSYNGKSGYHDDLVMALMLSIHAVNRGTYTLSRI